MNKKFLVGTLLLLSIPIVFLVGKTTILHLYGIDRHVIVTQYLVSMLDFLLTFFVVAFFLVVRQKKLCRIKASWINSFKEINVFGLLYLMTFLFTMVVIYYSPEFLSMIVSGMSRQAVRDLIGVTPLPLMVAEMYFLVGVSFIQLTKAPLSLKIWLFLGFILVTVVMTSRSNLILYLTIFMIFKFVGLSNIRELKKISLIGLVFVGLAVVLGVFVQNRNLQSHFMGPLKPVEDLFLYQSYSLVLANVAVEFSEENNKIFFPFFGYVSEYFNRLFNQEGVVDSDFVVRFHVFYSDVRMHSANVLYPWWSWFYGVMGIGGVVLKAAYVWLILNCSLFFRSFPFIVTMIYYILFAGFSRHPFMSLDAFVFLFFVILISYLPRIKFKELIAFR